MEAEISTERTGFHPRWFNNLPSADTEKSVKPTIERQNLAPQRESKRPKTELRIRNYARHPNPITRRKQGRISMFFFPGQPGVAPHSAWHEGHCHTQGAKPGVKKNMCLATVTVAAPQNSPIGCTKVNKLRSSWKIHDVKMDLTKKMLDFPQLC